ncbi:hypothetical protein PCAR4_460024 [Paraburkholderia caribensis]|nr:hypothetical protein PCAR4_460024 [Paraburkholderia caribensis]
MQDDGRRGYRTQRKRHPGLTVPQRIESGTALIAMSVPDLAASRLIGDAGGARAGYANKKFHSEGVDP